MTVEHSEKDTVTGRPPTPLEQMRFVTWGGPHPQIFGSETPETILYYFLLTKDIEIPLDSLLGVMLLNLKVSNRVVVYWKP